MNMTSLLIAFLLLLVFILIFFLFWYSRKMGKGEGSIESIIVLQNQMESLRKQLSESLSENAKIFLEINKSLTENIATTRTNVDQKLEATTRAMVDVHKQLGIVDEAVKKVFDVGKDISSLQEILRAPKLRGGMGELFLADLLSQIKPATVDFFELQYAFKSGEKVDAIIRVGEKLVPVDAKFPLENFRKFVAEADASQKERYRKEFIRDVKKHIDTISSKYILPEENTYDFALMYIPAENIYYETIIRDEDLGDEKGVFQYSLVKKVIPVSPNSFYAYLQVISMGLKEMQVEERAKEIVSKVSGLQSRFKRLFEDFETLGKHIGNSNNTFEKISKKLEKFDDSLDRLLEAGADEEKIIETDE